MQFRDRLLVIAACAFVLLLASGAVFAEQVVSDRTEAPYFFVNSDDPDADRLPLKSTDVDVKIAGVIADVKVVQRYHNEGKRPIEARYVFPGGTRAAIHDMRMRVGNRIIVAEIREKKQARAEYDSAKRQGKTASLLEQQRPNVLQMNVANILPGDDVTVELSYAELLLPTDGRYQFVYPTVVGPRYNGSVESGGGKPEAWISTPHLHAGEASASDFKLKVALNAGMAIKDIASATHKLDVKKETAERAVMELVKGEKPDNDRDFILDYRLAGDRVDSGLLLYQGSDENFFLAMLEPPRAVKPEQITPREYIFIVDVSGSMSGFPLDTAKVLVADLIGNLKPADSFNVMTFSGGNQVLGERSLPATKRNIERGILMLREQRGGGSTELLPAMRRALALPRDEGKSRTIVVVTDGYVTVETEAFDLIRKNLGEANLFAFGIGSSVNRHLIEGMARAGRGEPYVVSSEKTAREEATRFRRYIEAPVLTSIKVHFDGFDAYDVEPVSVPDVFAARPVLVFGKWRGDKAGQISIEGATGNGRFLRLFNVAHEEPREGNAALKYLWAKSRIATLSDDNQSDPSTARTAELTQLGLNYHLLTQYTSFIAVDQAVRNPGSQQEGVDQPLPLPQGVSDLAVGGEVPSTPEPETYLLVAVMLAVLLWMQYTGRLTWVFPFGKGWGGKIR